MPAPTIVKPNLVTDPGFLYWAPVGTTAPTNTVIGSVFTDAWASPWVWLGMTASGSDWSYNMAVSPVDAAESLDPIAYRTTGRTGSASFMLMNVTASNMAKSLNGATTVVTGSTGTTLTKVTPVAPGNEVRCMIGWESLDGTMRKVAYQVLNSGDVKLSFNKAPAATSIPWNAVFEIPSSTTTPFDEWYAGVARS